MTKSTCLHIQDRESGPIRVVEIPWTSVRIGRAAYCEVRLSDHGLADLACRLKRQGRSWHLIPVATPSVVWLEGRPIDSPSPLPYGVPFHVGGYCLTLCQDQTAQPDWGMYGSPFPRQLEGVGPAFRPAVATNIHAPGDAASPADTLAVDRMSEPSQPRTTKNADPAGSTNPPSADVLKHRWETRWRAAGVEITSRARAERSNPASEPTWATYGAGFPPVPLKDARAPRPAPFVPPRAQSTDTTPSAAALEPRQVDIRRESPTYGKPFSAVPPSPLGLGVPTRDAPKIEAPRDLPSGDAAPPPAAPLSFWDTWTPSDETIDSLRQESQPPDEDRRAGEHGETAASCVDDVNLHIADVGSDLVASDSAGAPADFTTFPPDSPQAAANDDEQVAGIESQIAPNAAPRVTPALKPHEAPPSLLFAAPVGEKREPTPRRAARATQAQGATVATRRAPARESERPSRPDETDRSAAGPSGSSRSSTERRVRSLAPQPAERSGNQAIRPAAPRGETARMQEPREQEREQARDVARASMGTASDGPDWPSARDILAMHQASQSACARAAVRKETRACAVPTVAREPARWELPAWLAGPPIVLFVLVCGTASCILSLAWAGDSYSASIVTERLLSAKAEAPNRPLPDGVVPPEGTWLKTTAQHLAHWGLYMSRSGDAAADPKSVDIRGLFERAIQVSPINPTARLALAQLDRRQGATTVTIGHLGFSRDVVCLAASASWLLTAGRKDAALRMYHKALEVGSHCELSHSVMPRYSDDPAVPRYLLPGEEAVREVVRALVLQNVWPFAEWSQILPKGTTVPLVAARLLREQGKREAESLIDLYLQPDEPRKTTRANEAVLGAARAEANALRSHWKEAEQEYRQAIDLVDDDTIKRSWWFNLADIAFRLDDEAQRQAALRAALAVATSDDITRRVTEKERSAGPRARLRSTGTKAN